MVACFSPFARRGGSSVSFPFPPMKVMADAEVNSRKSFHLSLFPALSRIDWDRDSNAEPAGDEASRLISSCHQREKGGGTSTGRHSHEATLTFPVTVCTSHPVLESVRVCVAGQ